MGHDVGSKFIGITCEVQTTLCPTFRNDQYCMEVQATVRFFKQIEPSPAYHVVQLCHELVFMIY